jgi:tetratricopeptide (TPR) repeat protein
MENLQKEIESILYTYKSGNFLNAEKKCKRLIKSYKKQPFLYNLAGLILSAANKTDESLKYYFKGLDLDPNYAIIYNNIGLLFFNKGGDYNIEKSKNFYEKSISLDKKLVEPCNNLGNLYNSIGNYEQSINYYNKAIKINSNFYLSYFNLASVYITKGEFDDAKKFLKICIKTNPKFTQAHRSLARITKYKKDDNVHVKQLISILRLTDYKDTKNKIELCFALGKAFEDLKDFKKSFSYYKEGNILCRKNIQFSIDDEKNKINKIKDVFNKKLFKNFERTGNETFSPIFILGMPRSGTTLVEQMLSNHSEVYGCDELNLIPELINKYFTNKVDNFYKNSLNFGTNKFEQCGSEYILKINKITNNKARFTDKLPINFLNIGFIKLILPNAKIINCVRGAKDNIFSIFKNYFSNQSLNFAYDIKELVNYYNLYQNLMIHWNEMLPKFIYKVKYENLVTKPKNEIKNMLDFCNLSWEDSCLDFHKNKRPIKTASDVQARKKVYKTSVNAWKNYKASLGNDFSRINE